jgi:hypothetical protein
LCGNVLSPQGLGGLSEGYWEVYQKVTGRFIRRLLGGLSEGYWEVTGRFIRRLLGGL